MIISPFFQLDENQVLVAVRNLAYVVNTDTNEISEAEGQIPSEFLRLVEALSTFRFENNEIRWFHGISKMRYSIEEGKFFLGNSEIISDSFVNHVLAAGIIRYEHKATAELFVEASSNIDKYITLDFVQTFENANNVVDLFKLEENVYTSTFNKYTRMQKFAKVNTANSAVDYVTEKTGLDASMFLSNLLEGEAADRVVTLKKVENLEEMIHFLKDQRNLLADADRSIDEIKAADALIEGEIKKIEADLAEVKATL
jgi:hypothetical protein